MDDHFFGAAKSLAVYVNKLRQAVRDDGDKPLLQHIFVISLSLVLTTTV